MPISNDELDLKYLKSSAQVEICGRPLRVGHKSCGLKPNRKRPHRLMGRFSEAEKDIVMAKVKAAGVTVNEFIRCVTLEKDYRPPEWTKAVFATNRELTAQGRNFNQIAKHVNSGGVRDAAAMLDAIHSPLVRALHAAKNALTPPQP